MKILYSLILLLPLLYITQGVPIGGGDDDASGGDGAVGGDVAVGGDGAAGTDLTDEVSQMCGVGVQGEAGASADASDGVQVADAGASAQLNLPSCSCIRGFSAGGLVESGGIADGSSDGGAAGGEGQVSVRASMNAGVVLALPGVNCVEDDDGSSGGDDTGVPDVATPDLENTYTLQIKRDMFVAPQNEWAVVHPISGGPGQITYKEGLTPDNPITLDSAILKLGEESIYTSDKNDRKMPNLCDSYPEGSIEANIQKIMDVATMDSKSCQIEAGTVVKVPEDLPPVILTFDEKQKCGNYELTMSTDGPNKQWLYNMRFKWEIKDNCES